MNPIVRLLPRSLVGRVFTLYALVLVFFACSGLGLFLHQQFGDELSDVLDRSDALVAVASPTIADSAVIGDYDTIRRTLERAIQRSDYASAIFIDVEGGKVQARNAEAPRTRPPGWLKRIIEERMPDTNLPVNVGGRDYGVLRFTFAHDRVAGGLWTQSLYSLGLTLASLVGGLVLLRVPLGYWLSDLTRIGSFDASMSGKASPHAGLGENAPTEFKATFDVLNRAAANMQAQREQAAATLGAIGDGVLTLDIKGTVILCNPAARGMLEREDADMVGRKAHDLVPEVFGPDTSHAPWHARRTQVRQPGGELRVLDSTLSPICGPDGEVHGHVLALRDVTEQHALDQRLRTELEARERAMTALRGVLEGLMPQAGDGQPTPEDDLAAVSVLISHLVTRLQERGEQLNAIFALSPDGFVSFDAQGRINYVSPALERLTGLPDRQVLGATEAQFGALLAPQCSSGQALLADFNLLRAHARDEDTHRRDILEVARPTRRVLELGLRASASAAVSQVLYLRDITHESEVEQMKSEFLSTAAHELRTPMSNIFGFSELMMSWRLAAHRQMDVIATIHRQSKLMVSVVNELLDLARIEARRGKDFKLEDIDLREITAQVLHDFKPPQDRPAAQVTMPEQAVPVRIDLSKFSQALGNVLSNAYKYSPEGGDVQVSLVERHANADTPAPQVGIEVRDHGIGMTAEQLARVCERFYRADDSGAIPGTGLGMSIVKEIVELLGGTLEIASESGVGTTVTLWLPVANAAMMAPPTAELVAS